MKVSEFLNLDTLSELKLVAGEFGTHKEISTVTVIDTPDGWKWLKGNELVVTTAYAISNGETSLEDLIKNGHLKNISGLIVKTKRYIKEIPKDAIDLAEKLNIPLMDCPEKYAFCDLINPTLSHIIDKQSLLIKQSEAIHLKFMRLAIENNTIHKILHTLSEITGKPTAFIDTYFEKIYYSSTNNEIQEQLKESNVKEILNYKMLSYDRYEIANNVDSFGYIIMPRNYDNKIEDEIYINKSKTALEYASIVIILRMQMRISTRLTNEQYLSSFVEDLLLNNIKTEEEVHSRARLYGWDFSHGGRVVVVDINNIKMYYRNSLASSVNDKLEKYKEFIFEESKKRMKKDFHEVRYYKLSDLIVFIISDKKDEKQFNKVLEPGFEKIKKELYGKVPFTLTIGVGDYYNNIMEVYKSYNEARTSINVGYQTRQFDAILYFSKLESYKLLYPLISTKEAEKLYAKYIEPLKYYDRKHATELLNTLEIAIECGWNIKDTSEKLFVHYNTIKYRMQRIKELLDIDLKNHDTQLIIELSMKMNSMRGFVTGN